MWKPPQNICSQLRHECEGLTDPQHGPMSRKNDILCAAFGGIGWHGKFDWRSEVEDTLVMAARAQKKGYDLDYE